MTTDFVFGLTLGALGMCVVFAAVGFVRSVLAYRRLTQKASVSSPDDWFSPFGDPGGWRP